MDTHILSTDPAYRGCQKEIIKMRQGTITETTASRNQKWREKIQILKDNLHNSFIRGRIDELPKIITNHLDELNSLLSDSETKKENSK